MQLVLIRRLHRASGLFPLAAYLVFHAWEHWPVREGRDAVLERLERTSHAWLETLLLLVPLLVHAALGVAIFRQRSERSAYASPAFHRLQLATGVLSLLFILSHCLAVWVPRWSELTGVHASYNGVRTHAGTLFGVLFYVLGLAAVCTHVGQGVGVALARFAPRAVAPRHARAVGIGFGLVLYLVFVNELAAYAAGAALL